MICEGCGKDMVSYLGFESCVEHNCSKEAVHVTREWRDRRVTVLDLVHDLIDSAHGLRVPEPMFSALASLEATMVNFGMRSPKTPKAKARKRKRTNEALPEGEKR